MAVLSERITRLQEHFKDHKKDVHSRRGLMALLQRRRRLLLYMETTDPIAYKRVVEHYQIREGQGWSLVTSRSEFWTPPRKHHVVAYRPNIWTEFKPPIEKYQYSGFFERKQRLKELELRKIKKRKMGLTV